MGICDSGGLLCSGCLSLGRSGCGLLRLLRVAQVWAQWLLAVWAPLGVLGGELLAGGRASEGEGAVHGRRGDKDKVGTELEEGEKKRAGGGRTHQLGEKRETPGKIASDGAPEIQVLPAPGLLGCGASHQWLDLSVSPFVKVGGSRRPPGCSVVRRKGGHAPGAAGGRGTLGSGGGYTCTGVKIPLCSSGRKAGGASCVCEWGLAGGLERPWGQSAWDTSGTRLVVVATPVHGQGTGLGAQAELP